MLDFKFVVIILAVVLIAVCTQNTETNCSSFSVDSCPAQCVICPPCEVCSSISCQTEDFCENIGFNRSWWESVQPHSISSACKGTARCIQGVVTKVTDGDTLEVNNTSIRLALIDAPEYNEEGGDEARNFILGVCPIGADAVVDEDDNQRGGSYDRTVGVIYCNGVNLNAVLIESGYGVIDSRFCDVSEFADEQWTGCEPRNEADPGITIME